MKIWKLFAAILASTTLFIGCSDDDDNNDNTLPVVTVDQESLTFDVAGGTKTISVTSNRDWTITSDVDWLAFSPTSGSASAAATKVTVTALENDSSERTATITVNASDLAKKTISVTQSGAGGSTEVEIVYKNDFDKEEATKEYGTSGTSWPYLDQFEGWKNEEGTGASDVAYEFQGISVRTTAASDSEYSNYDGSGNNNFLFGSSAYFEIKNISLSDAVNYTLSFGTEKYAGSDADNTFVHSEFHVYISNDAQKWVELEYTFPNDDPVGKWDLASTTFTVPSGTSSLSIYISSDLRSVHRLDDLMLVESSEAGTAIDFSTGTEIGSGDTGEIIDATLAEFIAAEDSYTQLYRIKGVITEINNATYGNIYITDGTDTVYIYGVKANATAGDQSFSELGAAVGDTITVVGYRYTYNGTIIEMTDGYCEELLQGSGSGGDTGEIIDATLAEFIAAEESDTQLYRIKGVITSITQSTYGDIYITDGTDTVYIYGVKANATAGDQSFSELGAAVGDTITVVGYKTVFNGTIEMKNGYCEELLQGSGSGGDTSDDEFSSNITWTSGTNAYVEYGTVNGVSNVTIYKLGKNNSGGTATLSVPQGVSVIKYYGVSWNTEEATVIIEFNGTEVYSQTLRTNSGAKSTKPYTLTVTDEDCYTIDIQNVFGIAATPAAVDVTIKTDADTGERVLLFGLKAE